MSEYIKILEIGEKLGEEDYKVFFTGEKNSTHFNSFTNTPIYKRAPFLRNKVKKI